MENPIQSILILGATGRTGLPIMKAALLRGFQVTALVRHPEKLGMLSHHPNVEILKGDVLHYPDVYNAVQGNDAIISALGRDGNKVDVFTKGTENIIRAINRSSIQKLVCLSSIGAGSTKKLANWKLNLRMRFAGLRPSFEAKAEQEILLYQSPVNFTLVMAGTLSHQNKAYHTQAFAAQQAPCLVGLPQRVSSPSLANFMLDQLTTDSWSRKTVCVVDENRG